MSNPYDQVIRTYRDEDEGLSDVYLMATQEDAIRLADDSPDQPQPIKREHNE